MARDRCALHNPGSVARATAVLGSGEEGTLAAGAAGLGMGLVSWSWELSCLAWGSVSITQPGVTWNEPDSALAFLDRGFPTHFRLFPQSVVVSCPGWEGEREREREGGREVELNL